ncbi:MAG: penicillin-binding protein 2, partial [Candidatus Paceibacterota bacterium]
MKKSLSTWRIQIIFIAVIFVALTLISRLYFLQIIHGGEYSDRAQRQYVRPNQEILDRGSIYFTNKDGTTLSAATMKTGFVLSIDPRKIESPEEVFRILSGIIPIEADIFYAKAAKKDDPYEEISKHLDQTVADKIDTLKLPGVTLTKEKWRYYPSGYLASNVLGFIGHNDADDNLSGRYGLERYYEDVLARSENNLYINFFAEIFSDIKKSVINGERQEGEIVTTIEPSVQMYIEKLLVKLNKEYHPSVAGAIIMNPKNGDIYAMASTPTFNPNDFSTVKDTKVFVNPLVNNVYEMGSIIKPLTMAAGIDTGLITAKTTYDDKGFIILNGSRINNFDGKGRGITDMQQVLNQSLNTGASFVVHTIGSDVFTEYMNAYGVGQETGIDLPNEAHNLVGNLKSTRELEHATASFGQGIALTPVSTIRALASLSNGGVLVTPHIVKKINYRIGFVSEPFSGEEYPRVLKQESADEITRMLVSVVDNGLLNGSLKMEHFSVAAK